MLLTSTAERPRRGEGAPARPVETLLPPGTTAEQARRAAERARQGIDAGRWVIPAGWPKLIGAFLEAREAQGLREKTLESYSTNLRTVARVLSDRDPLELVATDCAVYQKRRSAETTKRGLPPSPETIRSEVNAVAVLQHWTTAQGWTQAATWADAPRPRERQALKRAPSLQEVGRFIRAGHHLGAKPPTAAEGGRRLAGHWSWWPAAMWALLVGLRTGEALRLRTSDVTLYDVRTEDGGTRRVAVLLVREGKTRSSVRPAIVAHPDGVAAFEQLLADRHEGGLLFPGRSGAYVDSQPLRDRVRLTCEAAGVDPTGICPHALRHAAATHALGAGRAGVASVAALLGHAHSRTTEQVYAHVVLERALPAALALGDAYELATSGRPVLRRIGG